MVIVIDIIFNYIIVLLFTDTHIKLIDFYDISGKVV